MTTFYILIPNFRNSSYSEHKNVYQFFVEFWEYIKDPILVVKLRNTGIVIFEKNGNVIYRFTLDVEINENDILLYNLMFPYKFSLENPSTSYDYDFKIS